jgi:N-acetylglucosamine-6-phosphate deacetylase
LIADGEHVHPAICAQLVRVKDPTRIALTSDQTAAAGAPPGRYSLTGRTVISDGTVVRLEDGTLAGSAATMDQLVQRMAAVSGMSATQVIAMASTVPARVLGEKGLGRIKVGGCADLVVLDGDLRVLLTMVGGKVKFRRQGPSIK